MRLPFRRSVTIPRDVQPRDATVAAQPGPDPGLTDGAGSHAVGGGTARIPLQSMGSAVLGFLLIVVAQIATTRNYEKRLHVLHSLARHLADLYDHPRTEVFVIALFIVGALLFGAAMRDIRLDAPFLPEQPASNGGRATRKRVVLAARIIIIAGAAWILLNVRLFNNEYSGWLVWLFWLTIVAFGAAVIVALWRSSTRLSIQFRWWEAIVLIAMIVFFLVLNVRDVNSWKYAAIGDEYAFFDFAKAMENGTRTANIFSQIGVYAQRPIGTTAIQALSMGIFGADSYGWRLATPIALAAAIPAVYLLGRELFDRQVAVFSSLVFATSHYLTSYSHTVYDNVFALVPFTWSIALAVIGLRRSSGPWMYAAGFAAGIGFYTFPTARMAPVVLVLFLLTLGRRAWQPHVVLPFFGALLVTGMPLFASDRWAAISVSRDRTVFGFTDSTTEGIGIRILENIPRSLLGFNYNPGGSGHFVSGSLLDPISAVFLIAGVGFALVRINKPAYRLLMIWLAVDILFAGIFSPYDRVGYDRLHLALPVVALLVGLAMSLSVRLVSDGMFRGKVASGYLALVLFVAGAPALAYLNIERFLVDSPKVVQTTEERMALGGIESPPCLHSDRTLAIIREPRPLLNPAIATYGWDRAITTRSLTDAETATDFDQYDCIVLARVPGSTAGFAVDAIVQRLETSYGFEQKQRFGLGSPQLEGVVLVRS